MSTKYPGGIVIANPTQPTSSFAPGVWTLEQMSENVRSGTWPSATAYFISTLAATYPTTAYGSAVDSSGNIYIVGEYGVSASLTYPLLVKCNSSGEVLWSKYITATTTGNYRAVAIGSSGNVYVTGYNNEGAGITTILTVKYDSSGAVLWQKTLKFASNPTSFGTGIAVDASENVHVCGYTNNGTQNIWNVIKYNSSGTLQWQTSVTATGTALARSISVDSSSNVYVGGQAIATYVNGTTVKLNSSGTVQWVRRLNSAAGSFITYGCVADSVGNLYSVAFANTSSGAIILKQATSGTSTWQRDIITGSSSVGTTVTPQGIAINSAGTYIYVVGYTDNNGSNDLFVVKYDSSGVIQWQRILGRTSGTDVGYSIAVDSSENLYISGYLYTASATNLLLFLKIPNSGSLVNTITPVGTYNFAYNLGGLNESVNTATLSLQTYTYASTTYTDATSTLGVGTPSLTQTISPIAPPRYWMGIFGTFPPSTTQDSGNGITVDGAGNIYVCGTDVNAATTVYAAILSKYNTLGQIQWQVRLDSATPSAAFNSVAAAASGNVYVAGYDTSSAQNRILIAKYNSSGALQWQRDFYSGANSAVAYGIAIDSSENVYVCGSASDGTATAMAILKYDSSGTIQWQRRFSSAGSTFGAFGIATNGTNVYITGYTIVSGDAALLVVYDVSGTLLAQRRLDTTTTNDRGYAITYDGLGNIYLAGQAATNNGFAAKYSSTYAVTWQRSYTLATTFRQFGIVVDPTGANIYQLGTNTSTYTAMVVMKNNPSTGGITLQRAILSSPTGAFNTAGASLYLDAANNLYISGTMTVSGTTYQFIFKYNPDYVPVGIYSVGGYDFRIVNTSVADSAGSLTGTTPAYTSSTTTYTDAAATNTASNTTLTSYVTTIA